MIARYSWASLLVSYPLPAQTSAIEGWVKDRAGKPLVNAAIQVQRLDVNRSFPTKADKRGSHYCQGLPVGFYAVKVSAQDGDLAGVAGIRTLPGAPVEVSFDLACRPQEQEAQIKSLLRKAGAEWSYVKIMVVQQSHATPEPSRPPPTAAPAVRFSEPKPDAATDHYRNAQTLAKTGNLPEMNIEIRKAAALDPANSYLMSYNLGSTLATGGHPDEAAEAFRTAIASAPDEPKKAESYYQYALCLVQQAKSGADGKLAPISGLTEALRRYLALAPNGGNGASARELLRALGADKK